MRGLHYVLVRQSPLTIIIYVSYIVVTISEVISSGIEALVALCDKIFTFFEIIYADTLERQCL